MSRVPTPVDACVDCVMWVEYGDDTHEGVPAGHGDQVRHAWGGEVPEFTSGCSEDCCPEDRDPWFSWSRCDVCGTRLGGDREHVTVWEDLEGEM